MFYSIIYTTLYLTYLISYLISNVWTSQRIIIYSNIKIASLIFFGGATAPAAPPLCTALVLTYRNKTASYTDIKDAEKESDILYICLAYHKFTHVICLCIVICI
jgi:hypothetical protein